MAAVGPRQIEGPVNIKIYFTLVTYVYPPYAMVTVERFFDINVTKTRL